MIRKYLQICLLDMFIEPVTGGPYCTIFGRFVIIGIAAISIIIIGTVIILVDDYKYATGTLIAYSFALAISIVIFTHNMLWYIVYHGLTMKKWDPTHIASSKSTFYPIAKIRINIITTSSILLVVCPLYNFFNYKGFVPLYWFLILLFVLTLCISWVDYVYKKKDWKVDHNPIPKDRLLIDLSNLLYGVLIIVFGILLRSAIITNNTEIIFWGIIITGTFTIILISGIVSYRIYTRYY
jgi:hypothetical protein